MAFNIREGFWGLEHLRLALCRRIFKMKPDSFIERYARTNVPVETCLDSKGKEVLCERCGFVIMKAVFPTGWQMEMCSALPIFKLDKPEFSSWLTTLSNPPKELETAKGFEPILHD